MTASGEGNVRLVGTDAGNTRRDVLWGDVRTEQLKVSTDPRQCLVVPYVDYPLRENDQLVLEMKGDSATTVDSTSTIRIPVTKRNLKTGLESESYLTGTDFGLSSTDVSIGTTYTVVGTYTVPVQYAIKIGHKTTVNSVIYASLAYT